MSKIQTYKNNGATFRLKSGKIVKPNEVFQCYEIEIPEKFFNHVNPIDATGNVIPKTLYVKKESEKPSYQFTAVERSPGWWDVVNESEKPINETALRKADADKLIQSLNS